MRHDLTIELDTHITVTFELEGEKTASILDGLERVTRARTAGRAR